MHDLQCTYWKYYSQWLRSVIDRALVGLHDWQVIMLRDIISVRYVTFSNILLDITCLPTHIKEWTTGNVHSGNTKSFTTFPLISTFPPIWCRISLVVLQNSLLSCSLSLTHWRGMFKKNWDFHYMSLKSNVSNFTLIIDMFWISSRN